MRTATHTTYFLQWHVDICIYHEFVTFAHRQWLVISAIFSFMLVDLWVTIKVNCVHCTLMCTFTDESMCSYASWCWLLGDYTIHCITLMLRSWTCYCILHNLFDCVRRLACNMHGQIVINVCCRLHSNSCNHYKWIEISIEGLTLSFVSSLPPSLQILLVIACARIMLNITSLSLPLKVAHGLHSEFAFSTFAFQSMWQFFMIFH